MTKAALTTLTLSFLLTTVFAQKNIYIGIEAAVTHDIYEIIDNDGMLLKKGPIITGYFGFNARKDFGSNAFVETGLLRKYYNEGVGFKVFSSYSSGTAISCWLVPVRLGAKINIIKTKLHLIPVIGYTFCINSDYGYGNGGIGGFSLNSTDTIYHSTHSNFSLRRNYSLLQTGLGLEFNIFRTVLISVTANYYTGFTNVIEQDINYTHNSSPSYTAVGLSKGEMVGLGVAFKYPINYFFRHSKR